MPPGARREKRMRMLVSAPLLLWHCVPLLMALYAPASWTGAEIPRPASGAIIGGPVCARSASHAASHAAKGRRSRYGVIAQGASRSIGLAEQGKQLPARLARSPGGEPRIGHVYEALILIASSVWRAMPALATKKPRHMGRPAA